MRLGTRVGGGNNFLRSFDNISGSGPSESFLGGEENFVCRTSKEIQD